MPQLSRSACHPLARERPRGSASPGPITVTPAGIHHLTRAPSDAGAQVGTWPIERQRPYARKANMHGGERWRTDRWHGRTLAAAGASPMEVKRGIDRAAIAAVTALRAAARPDDGRLEKPPDKPIRLRNFPRAEYQRCKCILGMRLDHFDFELLELHCHIRRIAAFDRCFPDRRLSSNCDPWGRTRSIRRPSVWMLG